jgi:hypothetical protein
MIRAAFIAGLAVSTVVAFAAPAWADVATVHGTTTCSNAHPVVRWTLTNGSAGAAMLVGTASAQIGADSFAATGFAASVAATGTTSATSVVPGFATGLSGPLMLSVNVSWPNDNFSTLVYGSVDVGPACSGSTTTTVSQPTTTTATPSPTTTTTRPLTTTTTKASRAKKRGVTRTRSSAVAATKRSAPASSTATTTPPASTTTLHEQAQADPTSTTRPGAFTSTLAFTGSGTTFILLFGLCFVTVGGSVLLHKRNALAGLRGHETNDELRRQRERKRRSLWVYLPPR